ncbi:hypothetical protein CJF31_00003831 [Rutstroemia sp. NJR-2017a BVV2]|jgi:hypothetical protein
MMKN